MGVEELKLLKQILTEVSTLSKTADTSLLALQKLTTAPRVAISSELFVSTKLAATIFAHLGRLTESAFTAGVNIRIAASSKSTGDGHWYTLTQFTSALGSSVGSESVKTATAVGDTVIPVASTTGFTAGDIVYIDDPTLANSEFGRVKEISTNTSITLEDGLKFAHGTSAVVYDQAEFYIAQIDCTSITRLRVVVDGSGAAQNFVIEVDAVTADS